MPRLTPSRQIFLVPPKPTAPSTYANNIYTTSINIQAPMRQPLAYYTQRHQVGQARKWIGEHMQHQRRETSGDWRGAPTRTQHNTAGDLTAFQARPATLASDIRPPSRYWAGSIESHLRVRERDVIEFGDRDSEWPWHFAKRKVCGGHPRQMND
ncbi:hypothetical protein BDP27DRAFT_1372730 [Rhodocollybia butyracea]|uniref:Uncharacterized protein n=1 Tax=Rhodocollybia butyracea TaxID=206335 RepID=A0A9P5P6V1_9AGAR|nr:hypothetical protein BDP27DRAFT_1372730 [Rhodocollybia butyracea]